jgi:hypothetical protein
MLSGVMRIRRVAAARSAGQPEELAALVTLIEGENRTARAVANEKTAICRI